MKNAVMDQLVEMSRRAKSLDEKRIEDDWKKADDLADKLAELLSRHQSQETLSMLERRLGSLLGSVKARLSISKVVGA